MYPFFCPPVIPYSEFFRRSVGQLVILKSSPLWKDFFCFFKVLQGNRGAQYKRHISAFTRDSVDSVGYGQIADELPRVRELAEKNRVPLYYIVLTADAEEIERRIRERGDVDLIERALFLKKKLENMPENQGHIYDNTGKKPEDAIHDNGLEQYQVQ